MPLILPNFALPLKPGDKEPFVIKDRKVFGITSQGMMCSPQELGLPDQVDGLLILPADATVGQPFGELSRPRGGDVVYDLEVTPNRPDLNSVIGIAREIAAVTGNALKIPAIVFLNTDSEPIGDMVSVRNDEPELCPRYTARIVRQVKVGPSPDWLRSTLEKVGIRSINNVVDITNYVMLESGQPLHAFDYQLLKVDRLQPVSRRARCPPHDRHPPRERRRKIHDARRQGTHADESNAAHRGRNASRWRWPESWAEKILKSTINHRRCADRKRVFQTAKHPRDFQETRIAHRCVLSF